MEAIGGVVESSAGIAWRLSGQPRWSKEFFEELLRHDPNNERVKDALAAFSR